MSSLANPQVDLTQVDLNRSGAALPNPIIEGSASEFCEKFNRSPFMFSHALGEHPLFEIPRLVELAATILRNGGNVRCQTSDVPVHLKWHEAEVKEQLLEHMANIDKSGSWLLLYSVQCDPEYQALLDQVVTELETLTGVPLRQESTSLDAYIFVASPHSVTPYHIDHDSTFLFQIHGERESNLFDPYDRSLLTDQELENFYIGDQTAANYKEENQSKAYVYPLVPGKGVHHPVFAPHWYKNGNSYSVALGIHLGLHSFDLLARVYQVNHYLRKLGFEPTPPGKSALQDKLKMAFMGMFVKRKPETKLDLFYSGVYRIRDLLQAGKRMMTWFKR